MARYTFDELEKEFGFKRATLRQWKKRGNIELNEYDEFDTSISKNAEWLAQKKRELRKPDPNRPRKKRVNKPKEIKKAVNREDPKELEREVEAIQKANEFTEEKRKLELEKLRNDNELKRIQIEQKEGEFVKTEDVIGIIRAWGETRDKELCKSIEREIKYICDREGIAAERAGRYINKVPSIINDASNKANERLKDQIG